MKKYPIDLLRNNERIRFLKSQPVEKGGILLYGSSFFTRWEHAREEMLEASNGKYRVTNHGFGGALVDDLLYHYAELVPSCEPEVVVFRMGVNDVNRGFSGQETWDMAWRLAEFIRADFPEAKMIFLCAFDYKSLKSENYPLIQKFNALQKEYAEETENAYYMDINDFFHESPESMGTLTDFKDVFVEDGLHLKPEAYKEFAAYFTARLDELNL